MIRILLLRRPAIASASLASLATRAAEMALATPRASRVLSRSRVALTGTPVKRAGELGDQVALRYYDQLINARVSAEGGIRGAIDVVKRIVADGKLPATSMLAIVFRLAAESGDVSAACELVGVLELAKYRFCAFELLMLLRSLRVCSAVVGGGASSAAASDIGATSAASVAKAAPRSAELEAQIDALLATVMRCAVHAVSSSSDRLLFMNSLVHTVTVLNKPDQVPVFRLVRRVD